MSNSNSNTIPGRARPHMPTVAEWNAALDRARVLDVRLFYHDAGHISIISREDGRHSGSCADWGALLDWLEQREQVTP